MRETEYLCAKPFWFERYRPKPQEGTNFSRGTSNVHYSISTITINANFQMNLSCESFVSSAFLRMIALLYQSTNNGFKSTKETIYRGCSYVFIFYI